jgi:hypothetical protein
VAARTITVGTGFAQKSVWAIENCLLALSWTGKSENLALCEPYSSASYLAPFILHISTFMMKQRGSEDERSAETTITLFFISYRQRGCLSGAVSMAKGIFMGTI